jgi:hypothetical protein
VNITAGGSAAMVSWTCCVFMYASTTWLQLKYSDKSWYTHESLTALTTWWYANASVDSTSSQTSTCWNSVIDSVSCKMWTCNINYSCCVLTVECFVGSFPFIIIQISLWDTTIVKPCLLFM